MSKRIGSGFSIQQLKRLLRIDDVPDLKLINGVVPTVEIPGWFEVCLSTCVSTSASGDLTMISIPADKVFWVQNGAIWTSAGEAGNFDYVYLDWDSDASTDKVRHERNFDSLTFAD